MDGVTDSTGVVTDSDVCADCGEDSDWLEIRRYGVDDPVTRIRRCCPTPPTAGQTRRWAEDDWLRRQAGMAEVAT